MPLLEGRRALIFGVANRRSIAWAIAQALAREGAELAFTFQGERIEQGVRDLAATVNSALVVPADVTSDADLDRVFEAVDKTWAGLEAEVRYLAYELGPKNIRVNAISAGPVRTLAARSITGFTVMEDHTEKNAPLRRNISADDVGNAALYLCGPLASNVTGHILMVDAGYSILGMSVH